MMAVRLIELHRVLNQQLALAIMSLSLLPAAGILDYTVFGSVQTVSHIWIGLSGARTGSHSDGSSHLLVLQQVDVQVSFGRPRGAGDVPEPGRGEVERRLPVGE